MTDAFEITAADVGFLTARPTDPALVAKAFQWVHMPGLPVEQVQYHPPLPPATCDAIAALVKPLHPQAVLSFTQQDEPELANIQAASHPAEVAGVVAEVKRRDECFGIQITTARVRRYRPSTLG
jgi:hypothetical protein